MSWRDETPPTADEAKQYVVFTTEVGNREIIIGTFDTLLECAQRVCDISTDDSLDPQTIVDQLVEVDYLLATDDIVVEPPDVLKPYYRGGRSLRTDGGPYTDTFFIVSGEDIPWWYEMHHQHEANRVAERKRTLAVMQNYIDKLEAKEDSND